MRAVGIVIYIRYRQIKLLILDHSDLIQTTSATKLSWISLWIGLGSCLGISIVANFQETNVRIIHFVGAFICFGFGTVYFWLQACIVRPAAQHRWQLVFFLYLLGHRFVLSASVCRFDVCGTHTTCFVGVLYDIFHCGRSYRHYITHSVSGTGST